MKRVGATIRLSASDLSNHLGCPHVTSLDLAVVRGFLVAPNWRSPDAAILAERGRAHEESYLQHLAQRGLYIADLREVRGEEEALGRTLEAMARGIPCIAQATLSNGHWFGRADVLRRVERRSNLGDWSYEVYDCKLASETRAGTILQLSLYSELVSLAQGTLPDRMYVVTPGADYDAEAYRVLDFSAYYRHVKLSLGGVAGTNPPQNETYPEPTIYCGTCRWFRTCDTQWRRDDHLSLVAGINRSHRKQLVRWDTGTVEALSRFPLPIQRHPEYGSQEAYTRLREQARIQVQARYQTRPVHEILPFDVDHGFMLMPEPSTGDVFFDLEGDPFVGTDGCEYLFGFAVTQADGSLTYSARWALSADEEKRAFEWFVDSVMALWSQFPAMHVYHFTHYEPSALKRLMGRYATREDEIDRLLRARRLIDVHTILKRSVRASVEEYSLKALEPFHAFVRAVPLEVARSAMRVIEHCLELTQSLGGTEGEQTTIAGYNADDCLSTKSLRDWLERERAWLVDSGVTIPRPTALDGAPSEALTERQERTDQLAQALRRDVPIERAQRSREQSACWLLADLLDWHRRENKVELWEYFRFSELTDEDLLYERSGISGLRYVGTIERERNIPVDRYRFDRQETDIRGGEKLLQKGEKIGEARSVDPIEGLIDIKKMRRTAGVHPSAVFADPRGPSTQILADALFRLGAWVIENGIDGHGPYRAARDLLLRCSPRLAQGDVLRRQGEPAVGAATRIVSSLQNSVLAIQGPPGAGKTFTGGRMILEAVRQGKRVGVTAISHKVIRNLLDSALTAAREARYMGMVCIQKLTDMPEEAPAGITLTTDNNEALAAIRTGANLLGGTQWMWASEGFFEAVDLLFVDEAGQMALANVLAAANGAKNVVLLGDPQQLEQPMRGSHPDGADVSALEHLLDGAKTIPEAQGLFLEQTWRLHPSICRFTSEVFYENRLESRAGLDRQRIEGHAWLGNAGLWFVPVAHEGNQNASPEEVDRIAGIVNSLIHADVFWIDDTGRRSILRSEDILIVAPYNAQVADLSARLLGMQVGTVDRFQGQQAPVVIYSLTASSQDDAPRGMEFLYSLNRFNVATSRAKVLVIVVGSPRLLEPDCRNPRQMQLANALCRYVELAQVAETATQGI